MRAKLEGKRGDWLLRFWNNDWREVAYAVFGLRGPRLEIEFPSDWHESRRAWVRIGTGILQVCFSFPWRRVVPDEGQCSGPTFGFYCCTEALVIHWGKSKGRRGDPCKFLHWPWSWEHVRHDFLKPDGSLYRRVAKGEYQAPAEICEKWSYVYHMPSRGETQVRWATINGEEREWRWRWLTWVPWPRRISRVIDVEFDNEIGERSGSWKGGTTGCSWEWRRGETMEQALRRMERERRFR